MKGSWKTGIALALAATITGLVLLWFWTGNRTVDIKDAEPEITVTAENLIHLFRDQPTGQMVLIPEQIVEIAGTIKEINTLNERQTILIKGTRDTSPYIICDLQSGQDEVLQKLAADDHIRLKGVFKGFLKDAVFLNCIITESEIHD